jgi:hypothetical protein
MAAVGASAAMTLTTTTAMRARDVMALDMMKVLEKLALDKPSQPIRITTPCLLARTMPIEIRKFIQQNQQLKNSPKSNPKAFRVI